MDDNIRNAQDSKAAVVGPPLSFCTGFGQADTNSLEVTGQDGQRKRSNNPSAGLAYRTITPKAVVELVENPLRTDKIKAQWIIPSTYTASDARTHSVQRERGAFWFLPLDVDKGDLSLDDVDRAIVAACGEVNRAIYSTRSAQKDARKWRAFVALSAPIAGADYSDTMHAFNDLLAEVSGGLLEADRALCRPGQLVYLPNRGDFYDHRIARDRPPLILSVAHQIIKRRETNRAARAEIERRAAEEQAARRARRSEDGGGVVGAFNDRHEIADLFIKYDYEWECVGASDWRSPYQTSGSFATRDFCTHWISLSGSDAEKGLGREINGGGARYGDAFDLFVYFEHNGNFGAAVRAYAAEAGIVSRRIEPEVSEHFTPLPYDDTDDLRSQRLLTVFGFNEAAASALSASARPLIKGLLDEGAFSVVYGPSNAGKTFVALDLAYHVALGLDWGGMKTRKAAVLYLAAEGGGGIKKRIAALRQRAGSEVSPDFYLSTASVDLRTPAGDTEAVIATAQSIGPVGLIIVDTLSRALAGGDEDTKDLGAFVINADKIRRATGAHVLVIHHSGKDASKGARGGTVLRGAIDTEINIDGGRIKITKQRDLEFAEDISFEIHGVPIGLDPEGDLVTSATIRLQKPERKQLSPPTAKELEILATVTTLLSDAETGTTVTAGEVAKRHAAEGSKLSADAARKHLDSLVRKGQLHTTGRGKWAVTAQKYVEIGPKSGNSTSEKSTYPFPAYGFRAQKVEDNSEEGVFE